MYNNLRDSCKGMGRVCGRFQVQVLMGTKIYLYNKKNNVRDSLLQNHSFERIDFYYYFFIRSKHLISWKINGNVKRRIYSPKKDK